MKNSKEETFQIIKDSEMVYFPRGVHLLNNILCACGEGCGLKTTHREGMTASASEKETSEIPNFQDMIHATAAQSFATKALQRYRIKVWLA